MIILTPAVLSVLHACVLYFCICARSAQLSMFHMVRRTRNTLIIIIIIIITIIIIIIITTHGDLPVLLQGGPGLCPPAAQDAGPDHQQRQAGSCRQHGVEEKDGEVCKCPGDLSPGCSWRLHQQETDMLNADR